MKKMLSIMDQIAKTVMAIGALSIIALAPVYGSDKWYVAVVAVYGALGVYFTKNLGSSDTRPPVG